MRLTSRPTAFVTGADGFLGGELVQRLVALGHQVAALASSVEAAERLRRAGATPVPGDLTRPGRWQDEAAADWVFHLPSVRRARVLSNIRPATTMAHHRLTLDAHLLDAVSAGPTRQVVYVAEAGLYGAAGPYPVTEDEPRPTRSGRWLLPVIERLESCALAGLPIVVAIPGCVYGHGGWFQERIAEPVMAGRRVLHLGARGPLVSPVHVHDCVRALVHLASLGSPGHRYFIANSDPVRIYQLASTFARLARRPLRAWRVPPIASRLVVGLDQWCCPERDAVFANIRLRGLGFRFEYPTVDLGVEHVFRILYE
ncbi:MAG: NAD-dependent epimerase/dehydratase family protein [Vicinamibacterales bacterium]